jgi:hypothetical protein
MFKFVGIQIGTHIKKLKIKPKSDFKLGLGIFVAAFSAIGIYVILHSAAATQYVLYVDVNSKGGQCSDNKTSWDQATINSPLCTLDKAVQLLPSSLAPVSGQPAPTDTALIYVRAGQYPHMNLATGNTNKYNISVMGYQNERPWFRGSHFEIKQNVARVALRQLGFNGTSINERFDIRGQRNIAEDNEATGFTAVWGGNKNTFRNNYIHDLTDKELGISTAGDDNQILGNYIKNVPQSPISSYNSTDTIIIGNRFECADNSCVPGAPSQPQNGVIFLGTNSNITIRKNIFIDTHGITLKDGSNGTDPVAWPNKVSIEDNVFLNTEAFAGITECIWAKRVDNLEIINNTCHGTGTILPSIVIGQGTADGATNVYVQNNIARRFLIRNAEAPHENYNLWGAFQVATPTPPTSMGGKSKQGSPTYISSTDLHLAGSSLGVDAGLSDNMAPKAVFDKVVPTTDIECTNRFNAPKDDTGGGTITYYDMGAYEYGGSKNACDPDTDPSPPPSNTGGKGSIKNLTATNYEEFPQWYKAAAAPDNPNSNWSEWTGAWKMPNGKIMVGFQEGTGPVNRSYLDETSLNKYCLTYISASAGQPCPNPLLGSKLAVWPLKDYDMSDVNNRIIYAELDPTNIGKPKIIKTDTQNDLFVGTAYTQQPTIVLDNGNVLRRINGDDMQHVNMPHTAVLQRKDNFSDTSWGAFETLQDNIPADNGRPVCKVQISRIRYTRDHQHLLAAGQVWYLDHGLCTSSNALKNNAYKHLLLAGDATGRNWRPALTISSAITIGEGADIRTDEWDFAEREDGNLVAVLRNGSGGTTHMQGTVLQKDGPLHWTMATKPFETGFGEGNGHPEIYMTKEGAIIYLGNTTQRWTEDGSTAASWKELKYTDTSGPKNSMRGWYPRMVEDDQGNIYAWAHIRNINPTTNVSYSSGSDAAYGKDDRKGWPYVSETIIMYKFKLNASYEDDSISPSVSLTAPTAGSTISGTFKLTANASDNVGVTKVEFYVDGSLKGTSRTNPYSFLLDTKTLANETHTFTAKAYDAANNSKVSAVVSATVNNPKRLGDLNGDNKINIYDLSIMLSNWSATNKPQYDINGNGVVDTFDLSILLTHYDI